MGDQIIIPIGVCVVLPVAIVAIVFYTRSIAIKKKTEILLKAIENGVDVDPKDLAFNDSTPKSVRSLKMRMFGLLRTGIILTALGIAFTVANYNTVIAADEDMMMFGLILLTLGVGFIVSFFVGKIYMAKEIAAEEKALDKE